VCFVSNAEQQFPAPDDVLFWNQIIKADQFIFSALRPETGWFSGLCNFFVPRCRPNFEEDITCVVPHSRRKKRGQGSEVLFSRGACTPKLFLDVEETAPENGSRVPKRIAINCNQAVPIKGISRRL
jgi:hypothetical protein